GEHQHREPAAVADQVDRYLPVDAEADGGVRPDADGEREHEQEELRAPPAAVHETHQGPGLAHPVRSVTTQPPTCCAARLSTVCSALARSSASMPSRTWLAS